jgi:hypothetical protein
VKENAVAVVEVHDSGGDGEAAVRPAVNSGFAPRLEALLADVAYVQEQTLPKLATIDAELHGRVLPGFRDRIAALERDLSKLEADAKAGASSDMWECLAEQRNKAELLFEDALGFTEGALVRKARLDDGLCAVADRMIEGWSTRTGLGWGRLTILAERDFFGEAAQIIRLRFPQLNVWSLPIAAHEFGHFAAAKLAIEFRENEYFGYRHPVQEILRDAWEADAIRFYHMHEYFADMFAAFVVGPAYAYSCAILRFDPAGRARGIHPSAAARFELIMRTLRKVDERAEETTGYSRVLADVESRWAVTRAEAGDDRPLGQALQAQIDAAFDALFPHVDEHLGAIRFSSMLPANRLKDQLVSDEAAAKVRSARVEDVLNAAWLCRLAAGSGDIDAISRRAVDLCART